MRNEEIMIDLADPVFTKTIRSRQNDKNGLKLTVYAREKGKPIDLTGCAVKYEATNHTGTFVRDDTQIADAKNGVFSYTFTSQAVSTSDDWTAYFVIEKNTERMSTPDIRIVLRRDVKEGNIKIENYISDFEILKKTIDELQRKLNTMDVVKKTGDVITGHIGFDSREGEKVLRSYLGGTNYGAGLSFRSDGLNIFDWSTNSNILDWDSATKTLTLANGVAKTNLMKKTGDIITGLTEFKSDNAIVLGSRSYKTVIHKGAQGELIFAPSTEVQGDIWDWSKRVEIRPDGTIRQATDTEWVNLPTTGVENVPDRILKYKRTGKQISVIGSVRNAKDVAIFATLPAGFRPVQDAAFPALSYGDLPSICEVTVKPDGGMFVNGVKAGMTVHIAMSYSI